ncbi:MAG: phosphoadenosine phosphosulfate reductase family protein [Candidatus Thorarchaeota archaeon]|jgi:phosphoadenosine phosphosulfate reductase
MNLDEHIEEAIEFLHNSIPEGERVLVGFSGGKDSIVTAWLMKRSGIEHDLVYSNTTIDPPAVLQFIKKHYPEVKWCRPKESFWKMIPKRNPPLKFAKWCCTTLKKEPSWKFPHKHRVFGIRREEGPMRRKYERIYHFTSYKQDHIHYRPILEWQEWAVWELIEREELAYPHLYDMTNRLGCVICPMRTKKQHEKWRAIYPGYYKAFEAAVKKWYNKRKAQGKPLLNDCPEDFIEAWYDQKATWYKNKKQQEEDA